MKYRHLLILFLASLLLRLAYGHFTSELWQPPRGYDELLYDAPARSSIEKGEFCHSGKWPLGEVLIHIAVYSLLGLNFVCMRVVSQIMSSLTVVFTALLAAKLFDDRVGIISGALACVHPWLIYRAHTIQTEVSMLFFLTLCFLLVLCYGSKRSSWLPIGLSFGFLLYIRPNALLQLPPMLVLFYIATGDPKKTLGKCILVTFLALLIFLPWCVKLSLQWGQFVFGMHRFGHTLCGGNCEAVFKDHDYRGLWKSPTKLQLDTREDWYSLDFNTRERILLEKGKSWISKNPGKFLLLGAYKLGRLFSLYRPFSGAKSLTKIATVEFWLILVLALSGLGLSIRHNTRECLFLLLWIAMVCAQCFVFHGANRYRYCFEPSLLIFAALALRALMVELGAERVLP